MPTTICFFASQKKSNHLDIVGGKESDHRVVLPFVPVLVHLTSNEYDVATPESQFPRRLPDKIVERPCHQTRLRRLILGSTSLTQIVHEIVVAIQRYGRLLRRSEIAIGICRNREPFSCARAANRDVVCSEQTPIPFRHSHNSQVFSRSNNFEEIENDRILLKSYLV